MKAHVWFVRHGQPTVIRLKDSDLAAPPQEDPEPPVSLCLLQRGEDIPPFRATQLETREEMGIIEVRSDRSCSE